MARNQKNFKYFTYVDENGVSWNKRGEDGGAAAGSDGHADAVAGQPVWNETRRNKVRKIRYQDEVTGRTIDPIFYTHATWAAVTLGSNLAVSVAGLLTTVDYTAVEFLPERKKGIPVHTTQLADS